ncbi:MAG: hypothetical protein Q7T00_03635 [Rugosibacter sp.]|jgi:hypothetical protein|nr:hypothetical protein [Rugosibacter sp.]
MGKPCQGEQQGKVSAQAEQTRENKPHCVILGVKQETVCKFFVRALYCFAVDKVLHQSAAWCAIKVQSEAIKGENT